MEERGIRRELTYRDVYHQNEVEQSTYNFEQSNAPKLFELFTFFETEAKRLLEAKLALPGYEMILKAAHHVQPARRPRRDLGHRARRLHRPQSARSRGWWRRRITIRARRSLPDAGRRRGGQGLRHECNGLPSPAAARHPLPRAGEGWGEDGARPKDAPVSAAGVDATVASTLAVELLTRNCRRKR